MATPTATDLYFKQGETLGPVLSKANAAGALTDWTGYTARLQVRPSVDSSTVYLSLTTENGGITIAGTSITLNPGTALGSGTGAVFGAAGQGVYDLEMVSPAGKVAKPFFGLANLIRAITK